MNLKQEIRNMIKVKDSKFIDELTPEGVAIIEATNRKNWFKYR